VGPVSVLSNIDVKAGEADLAWLVILYDIYCLMLLAPDPGIADSPSPFGSQGV